MTGAELITQLTNINGGASINEVFAYQLLNLAKAMVEAEREWAVLKKTDSSISVTTGNTWQSPHALVAIDDFGSLRGDFPIKNFDGSNLMDFYSEVPLDQRLAYKDVGQTFVFDAANNRFFLNGLVAFNGTLYLDYLANSADIDVSTEWVFPTRFHPILAFYAAGIYKGGVDYDDINARMAPENRALMQTIRMAMIEWDSRLQRSATQATDWAHDSFSGHRNGAINRNM